MTFFPLLVFLSEQRWNGISMQLPICFGCLFCLAVSRLVVMGWFDDLVLSRFVIHLFFLNNNNNNISLKISSNPSLVKIYSDSCCRYICACDLFAISSSVSFCGSFLGNLSFSCLFVAWLRSLLADPLKKLMSLTFAMPSLRTSQAAWVGRLSYIIPWEISWKAQLHMSISV